MRLNSSCSIGFLIQLPSLASLNACRNISVSKFPVAHPRMSQQVKNSIHLVKSLLCQLELLAAELGVRVAAGERTGNLLPPTQFPAPRQACQHQPAPVQCGLVGSQSRSTLH